jgi:hypothetical protein
MVHLERVESFQISMESQASNARGGNPENDPFRVVQDYLRVLCLGNFRSLKYFSLGAVASLLFYMARPYRFVRIYLAWSWFDVSIKQLSVQSCTQWIEKLLVFLVM